MLSFTVRMRFDEADRETIAELLHHLTLESRKEPGCVGEPATVVIYEQYVDEAALDHHRSTPHFQSHAVEGLYKKMRERQLENLIAIM